MKKILINEDTWQTRVAITQDDELQNIYFWSKNIEPLERSFFKGIITKVLPGIQTAFVDIGQERAGFLHISEIDRDLSIKKMELNEHLENIDDEEEQKPEQYQQPDISKILKEGETILVQVSKEPVYEKGAKLTTCFTLPGRFLVLMPNIPRIGISKKIESKDERQRLKEILLNNLPKSMGVIIRTTSEFKNESEILQDLNYLIENWNIIQRKFKEANPKEKIYQDLDLSLQVVRDYLDNDVESVITDNKDAQTRIYKFVKQIAPEYTHKIKYYEGPPSLFEKYNIEKQIEQALEKKVYLKSGGSIVIETTEAMTVVDVNTGRYTGQSNLEETILKTNIEASEEITRQLRLRNIGGLIVIDFIDMSNHANKQKLFRHFEKALKEKDKFQSVLLKISEFGLVQMTRKRSGKTLIQQLTNQCSNCHGLGFTKSIQNESFAILRKIKEELEKRKPGTNILLTLHPSIFHYITNNEYNSILQLEKNYKSKITLISKDLNGIEAYKLEYLK
ncbi:Rne/Rng family ribonuclease [Candidatus Babela massiliensis]|uniref:Ribonuclease G n=1 Tax=Candidatus Babela massiliensis TaxID=673862 RepID=V6DIC4_9BACT|nr:Rne/Rng family ribonuclease [Candidatus Babela massiliensis]CDK30678.1 Ribonuclease G and E [Candidatus Babela massiliensis]